jgi:hypothetical protein
MTQSLSPEDTQILNEKIADFNDDLITFIINLSGQAFNNAFKLGAILMTPVIVILLIVSALLERISFISFIVYICAGGMIAIAFAALVSMRAKTIALRDSYKEDINPKIVKWLAEHDFTRAQFDSLANQVLAPDAPLREYLVGQETPESEA